MNIIGSFKGKKLLILGANEESKIFVEKAHQLGIYVIVTDHIIDSPAKKIADKYYDINGKNVDEIVQMSKKEKIDGIILGVADPLAASYMKIASELDLPCYLSPNNIGFFTDKDIYVNACNSVGLMTAEHYYVGNDIKKIPNDSIRYPCIVKPTKGRGGKGVLLCTNKEELYKNFYIAKKISDSGNVMIEEYIEGEEVVSHYYFENNNVHLVSVSNWQSLKKNATISPVAYRNVYPSRVADMYLSLCHPKFVKLFHNLKIENGFIEMQLFWNGKDFYPFDMTGIVSGESSSPIINELYNIDFVEKAIIFAMTGQMDGYNQSFDELVNNKYGRSVWILLKPGVISKIEGMEEIKENKKVLSYIARFNIGDEITQEMSQTEKATYARIWISAKSETEVIKAEQQIREKIKVYGKNNESLIMDESMN